MTGKRTSGVVFGIGLLSLVLGRAPAVAQEPLPGDPTGGGAAPPAAGGAAVQPLPPVGSDFPVWLRPGGSLDAPEPAARRTERRTENEIETDRDSFTPSTRPAGRGRLIVESAYSFLDNRGVPETHSYPELLFRLGMTDRVELRFGWNSEVGGAANSISGSEAEDFLAATRLERESTVSYGVKVGLTEQDCWLPEIAAIVQGYSPTSGRETDTQLVATYAAGWVFANSWKFDAAIRYSTGSEEDDHFNLWAPSAVLKVPVGERWNVHAEYFGIFAANKARDSVVQYVSPGVHCLLTPDLEVGVRVGWGLNDQSARFFTNAGVGWRY